ncbi:MAG: dUTP diphosphatase [bacterium]|nr:dUTP diphosphatase [bacterium]
MQVKIKILREGTKLPHYKHDGDAGMDLVNMGDDVTIPAFGRVTLPTGIAVAIPQGYEIQVRPRSGMAAKRGITLLNTPGTIDAGYRGEICVIIHNTNPEEINITNGERIAQAVLKKCEKIEWTIVKDLDETTRNDGGFGSTGTHHL